MISNASLTKLKIITKQNNWKKEFEQEYVTDNWELFKTIFLPTQTNHNPVEKKEGWAGKKLPWLGGQENHEVENKWEILLPRKQEMVVAMNKGQQKGISKNW